MRAALARTSEAVRLLEAPGRQPYHDLPDPAEALATARVEGAHLEPGALLDVASFAEGASEIGRRVSQAPGAPALAALAAGIAERADLVAEIRRAILPSRELADDASPRLAEIRRALVRKRAQLHGVMESYLKGRDADRLLQDKLITTRNDRYVLLLKAEHRGQIPGIVHGGSGSGQSVFVEPMPAVELNNDIVSLADDERAEVLRILRELTSRVALRAADLARAAEILGELDALQAMALLAHAMGAHAPDIADGLDLELIDARHPLLSKEPVPVSLRVGFGTPVLVISGPNTGGKTVALKTIGLFALMAQCGLHVPAADGSRLPVFRRLYADIGDDQSIAESLSTFSAHLAAIVEMTKDLDGPALVLLDEVGAGTDPTEGGGLGVAIVDHFRARGAMVVATTHHGLMKAYAQATPGVACASFGYDPRSYEPTYRLELGVPGRSLALEMAERLGLPAAVVEDARSRLSLKEAQAEAMLKELEDERARLLREAERLAKERVAIQAEQGALRAAESALESRKTSELQAFAGELRRRGDVAARQAADAIKDAVAKLEETRRRVEMEAARRPLTARQAANEAARVRSGALLRIREAQDEALAGAAPVPEPVVAAPVAVGARARAKTLGVTGEVLAVSGAEAELAVGGKRLRLPVDELLVLGGRPGGRLSAVPRVNVERPAERTSAPAAEVNVIGLTVDEALPKVDKFLDESALADRHEVRVIHGFGQGKLRKAVAGLLDGHPHVAAFRQGGEREGGAGATIVELKD
ncbi:MAG TPA: Smr/MutS family protein [Vicinamibacteria bacterium]|nr:Smr/MutS family protein [Vicinamibacteria bacterium]